MRILFELGQPSHDRHQLTVMDELARRGHAVLRSACTRECPALSRRPIRRGSHREFLAFDAHVRDDDWADVAYTIRTTRDYLRYLMPEHAASSIIRQRARNMLTMGYDGMKRDAVEPLLQLLSPAEGDDEALGRLDGLLAAVEAMIPPHPQIVKWVRGFQADVMCITPMVVTQYGQTEVVKAARTIGLPLFFMAGSWDNLTTKGTTHLIPDETFVWNESQRAESVRFHGIPIQTVHSVGAPRFDAFWDATIAVSRKDYCRLLDLDPARPIITYLCSSNLIAGDERGFVRRWIAAIRGCHIPEVRDSSLLIRPHPKFAAGWQEAFAGERAVRVLQPGRLVDDPELFHCLVHAHAVIGANTSAELEAAILGKPVFSVVDADLESGQAGTLHYRYLEKGLTTTAAHLDEHVSQLAAELRSPDRPRRNFAFLESFLRPGGLHRRATDVTADAIESAARRHLNALRTADATLSTTRAREVPPPKPEGAGGLLRLLDSIGW